MVVRVGVGDCRKLLKKCPDDYFDCIVTSPPYFAMRDYGNPSQIGREEEVEDFIFKLGLVFEEGLRVLKPTGTLWLNIGDCYSVSALSGGGGSFQDSNSGAATGKSRHRPPKGFKYRELLMIPNRLAIHLQETGWYVRSEIIWQKPNPMPESRKNRPTNCHEKVWLMTKQPQYWFDHESLMEKGADGSLRFGRNVWSIPVAPIREAHTATMPLELAKKCIKAGCPQDGIVLDPFGGSGTTGVAAKSLGRDCVLLELNREYADIIKSRLARTPTPMKTMVGE